MSYVLINEEGTYEEREGSPTVDELIELVGGGVPDMVPTAQSGLVYWVNDDFQAREIAGTMKRNIIGSVVALGSGAPPQPLAGPVVFTGIERDPMEGYGPAELEPGDAEVLREVTNDVRFTVLGEGEPVHADLLTEEVKAQMRDAADMARTMPFRQATMTVVSTEDFLRMLAGQ
jgi:hypothetical protein